MTARVRKDRTARSGVAHKALNSPPYDILHGFWAFWGCCRVLVGMPLCTCDIDIMWDGQANGGVLIMVGLGERAILRLEKG